MPRAGHGHVQQGCVIRRDSTRLHGWQAAIRRHGVAHVKFFSDARNGGRDGAKVAADEWLAEKLATLPPPAAPWIGAVPMPASELGYMRRRGNVMMAEIRRGGVRLYCSRSIERHGLRSAEQMCREWLRMQRHRLERTGSLVQRSERS